MANTKLTPDNHPLANSASNVFDSAREGLVYAFEFLGSTNTDDTARMRLALGAIASACDSVKATANAYSNVLGQVQRAPKQEGGQ